MTEQDNYPLDEALISMVQDLRNAQMQLQGALTLFSRQHKLEGQWVIAESGTELVKIRQEVTK